MPHTARGTFTVTLQPLPVEGRPEGSPLGRRSIDKQIARDLVATTRGVPDSGTGALTGLSGEFAILIAGGVHSYEFVCELP